MSELLARLGETLEAAMLLCFGLSWPISILKSLRTKVVHGKSLGFLWLVLVGYLAGLAAKFLHAAATKTTPVWNTPLYAVNAFFVAVDLVLYYRYRHR